MISNIVASKVASVILASALTTGGAVAAANAPVGTPLAGLRQTAQNAATEVANFATGQDEKISAPAHFSWAPKGPAA